MAGLELDVDAELALARLERVAATALRPDAQGTRRRLEVRPGDVTWRGAATVLAVPQVAALATQTPWLASTIVAVVDGVVRPPAQVDGWDDLRRIAERRNDVARRLAGRDLLAVLHPLLGVPATWHVDAAPALPAPMPDGWRTPGALPPLTAAALNALFDVAGWQLVAGPAPWTAVRVPRVTALSCVELGGTSVRAWSLAMHELGHALVGLGHGAVPRVVDEAAAMATQRWPAPVFAAQHVAIAAAAQAAQVELAAWLAVVEAALYDGDSFAPPACAVPSVLLHDPGAQAAYGAAAASPMVAAPGDHAGLLEAVRARCA